MMPEPWSLLAALDELLAREDGLRHPHSMNMRIGRETGLIEIKQDFGGREYEAVANFLRSRDAAAMLEEAVIAKSAPAIVIGIGRGRGGVSYHQLTSWDDGPYVEVNNASEAAARTRAALEAGWRLGLWPLGGRSKQ